MKSSSSSSGLEEKLYIKLWHLGDYLVKEEDLDEFYSKLIEGNEIILHDYEFCLESFNWGYDEDLTGISTKDRGLRIEIIPKEFE